MALHTEATQLCLMDGIVTVQSLWSVNVIVPPLGQVPFPVCFKLAPSKPSKLSNMAFHHQDQPTTAPTGPSFGLAVEWATSDVCVCVCVRVCMHVLACQLAELTQFII